MQTSLIQLGERDGIHAIWEKLIGVNPKDYAAWDGTAEYWCFIGDIPEYERARRLLLDRFADATDTRTCELMGRACLLTPCSDDDLKRITSMLDRAIAHEQVKRTYLYPYILAAKTLAEYRAGHFQASIELVSDEVRVVSPTLSGLVSAMAHARLGHEIEARANLARAVASSQWTESAAIERNDTMIFQVLRHEAEPLIVPNLHAFLLGKYQPTDNNERIAMTAECAFTNRYAAAARSWIEALTAEPSRQSECFDGALVLLMLAGHGIGSDADRASETDRARWRNQALVWLRQIIALSKPPNPEGVRTNALLILTHWYNSADLTPLREGKYAEQLSKFERDTWAAAWREIAELVNGTRQ